MTKASKTFDKVIRGTSDNNILFAELTGLLNSLGFRERIRGSHHIYSKSGIEEIVNLQPLGGKAKSYQVKQTRNLILKYKLNGDTL